MRAVVLALVVGLNVVALAGASGACDFSGISSGACVTGGIDDGGVTLTGTETTGGSGASGDGGGGGGTRIFDDTPDLPCNYERLSPDCIWFEVVESELPTTVADLAAFHPTPGRQVGEPAGWTIAGLPTNFYAVTGVHSVSGTLLGRPAVVRFTPVAYAWTYGDGSSATRAVPGRSWAAQRQAEFTRTPTSHVYAREGSYTIRLTISFAAEYRFDGGAWRSVSGTIPLRANDLNLRAGSAQTVLVDRDCAANPGGPGC